MTTTENPLAAHHRRMEEMKHERIIAWSESLRRWCVCNGFAKILATATTKEEADALRHRALTAQQLPLFGPPDPDH